MCLSRMLRALWMSWSITNPQPGVLLSAQHSTAVSTITALGQQALLEAAVGSCAHGKCWLGCEPLLALAVLVHHAGCLQLVRSDSIIVLAESLGKDFVQVIDKVADVKL